MFRKQARATGSKMGHKREILPLILYSASRPAYAANCDCDCACALNVPQVLTVKSVPGLWVRQSQAQAIPLKGEWRAFFNPVGPVGVVALNAAAQQVLAAFDAPISSDGVSTCLPEMALPVVEETVDNLATVGLLHAVEMPAPAPAQPSTLSIWLHITEACNLNCPYCYVRKHPSHMSVETGRYAVDRLVGMAVRHGYTSLKLKYAGGEPTLGFPIIRAIHARAARQAAETGLALEEVLLTNGVGVTDTMLDFVALEGMQLMVSLDGGPLVHDQVRAGKNGQSTYAAVVDTVERALERGLHPLISITLTALNLCGAKEAVSFALERNLPFNLNFYRECLADSVASSSLVPDVTLLMEEILEIFDVIRMYPTYPLPLTGILDRTRLDILHSYACSAGRDYLAVGTRGQMSACQMLLEEPWASLSDADPLGVVRQRGASVFKPVDEHPECQSCLWRAACSGGCPLVRGTEIHTRYCLVYRALFPELIRLEASRLIANQSRCPSFSL